MSMFLTTMALFVGAASASVEQDAGVERATTSLHRGVSRAHAFTGWRGQFEEEAMQEAWCLLLEQHPEVVQMSEDELSAAQLSVTRRDGRVVDMPVRLRLVELGIKARNTVLRDNHLNRQVMGRRVAFADFEDEVGYGLRILGKKVSTAGLSE